MRGDVLASLVPIGVVTRRLPDEDIRLTLIDHHYRAAGAMPCGNATVQNLQIRDSPLERSVAH